MLIKYENDSRKVTKGQTFVAIAGHTVDGHDYIESAIANGAERLIISKPGDYQIPYELVDDTEKYLKEALVKDYSSNFNDLNFIGITGTNGKTTSCYLIYQMLKCLGEKVAYMGTIGFYYNDKKIILNNTTPDILTFYKLLLEAKENGIKTIVMEVSSHALCLERIAGIKFKVAGFTNLTEDHLDFHKDMDDYANAKLKIINYLADDAIMLVNKDDKTHEKFKAIYPCLTYGITNADYNVTKHDITPSKTNLKFVYQNNEYEVTTNLTSKFNVYNYILALSIVNQLGFTIDDIIKITKDIYPPKGRCETYEVNNGYAVIDYAHTPDAVEKVIEAYTLLKKNKLITIVGCGGDRDNKKRPIMGNIATKLSDYVIFTNDNPRTEDPKKIMQDIITGVNKTNYEIIFDRKEAIAKAISKLEKEDILLILGKGHEDYQIIGHEKIHLDDSEEVKKHIKK
ncbi:MAG: UDP-N-acetylmuramoyl-L-alanyl-D-glutamate--2,6-diaminopimelate ligase [Bacilli bacterium]|nr:UDP-N-acetylmuramoyl-L-alanyl-D-glutamate--2,6-diaminopimelate ligase [Bacilli bacterium]